MAASAGTVTLNLDANSVKLIRELQKAQRQTKRTASKMRRDMQRSFRAMGRSAAVFAVALGAAMKISIGEAVKFEKAMNEVSTLVGDTTNMDKLTESVKAISREFGQAPVEQAKALYQIISAGAKTASEQIQLLTASNKLAIGGVTDVKIAADALTTILNAYGLEAKDATDISDLLFVGMKAGKTTIEEMATSIGQVATIAAQTGVPIDQLIAGVATITKSGINTSEAMNGLRGALVAVLKQSTQSLAMAKKLGIEFNLEALGAKKLAGFLNDIQIAAKGDAEKLQKLFGRVEGLTAVMSLGANGAKEFNAILEQMGESAGETDKAFNKMAAGSDFQLNKLKVSVTLLGIELGNRLLPKVNEVAAAIVFLLRPTRDLKEILTDAATALRDLSDAMKENAVISVFQETITSAINEINALEGQINKIKSTQESWWRASSLSRRAAAADIEFLEGKQLDLWRAMRKAQGALIEEAVLTEVLVTATRRYRDVVFDLDRKLTARQRNVTKMLAREVAAWEEIERAHDDAARSLQNVLGAIFPVEAAQRRLSETLVILNTAAKDQGWTQGRLAEAVRRATAAFEEQVAAIRQTKDEMDEFAIQAARNIQTAFADFLFDPFDKGLQGMVKGFANAIRRMVAEAAAAGLLKAIFGGMSGSGFFGKLFGSLAGKAHGGPVAANTPYLVGERGPELIIPSSAGTVVPNSQIGGDTFITNIDARQTDEPARLLALVPVISAQIEQSLTLKARRGM